MARVGRRTKVRIDTKDAWGAVRAFEHMIPQLRSYARAMTGNTRLEVQVTAGPTRTDGNTIYITPPLALANKEVHSKRSECGKRSADGKLTCKACNIREVVNFYLYHEVSHILWGTLAMHNEFSLAIWHKMFNSWHHEGCEHYSSILELVDQAGSTMGLAGLLSPFVGMMQNALEDARVNERTFEQRAGLRKIFEINMDRMLIEGSEQLLSGELLHWRDQPLDAQFMVGLYFQASGYHYEGFLHSDAVAMLQNSEIAERVESAKMAEDADAVFALVCEIWLIAQNHGFCVLERCIPEPAIDETWKMEARTMLARMRVRLRTATAVLKQAMRTPQKSILVETLEQEVQALEESLQVVRRELRLGVTVGVQEMNYPNWTATMTALHQKEVEILAELRQARTVLAHQIETGEI